MASSKYLVRIAMLLKPFELVDPGVAASACVSTTEAIRIVRYTDSSHAKRGEMRPLLMWFQGWLLNGLGNSKNAGQAIRTAATCCCLSLCLSCAGSQAHPAKT